MIALLKEIAQLLRELIILVRVLIRLARRREAAAKLPNRMNKQEVLDQLKISESTYKRHLKNGLLKPIRLTGIDEYFEEDLIQAMEESRRRGRV